MIDAAHTDPVLSADFNFDSLICRSGIWATLIAHAVRPSIILLVCVSVIWFASIVYFKKSFAYPPSCAAFQIEIVEFGTQHLLIGSLSLDCLSITYRP